jgi:D-cysteine desulfhydrase
VRGPVALHEVWPALAAIPWARLGDWPTPVERLGLGSHDLWVKRDDLSAGGYGGNKVRTLEAIFGEARAGGARTIWSTGAFGSNHALASALHAPRAELVPAALLFPQPPTTCARENLLATLATGSRVVPILHWSTLPFGIWRVAHEPRTYVMVPGGATPTGALGYLSAALELAEQVKRGELPEPRRIVLGVGSTCTSAGLLAGLAIAARRGLGISRAPEIWSVRVTPWPVTAKFRIVGLAVRAAALLARLVGDERLALGQAELAPGLRVLGGYLGRGYGYPTERGSDAIARFRELGGPPLDTCYSGKAGACALVASAEGPTLFWATKSSRPLVAADADQIAAAPPRFRRWLGKATIG